MAESNSQTALITFVERVERLNEEIKAIQEDRKLIFQEAVVAGYDMKVVKRVIRDRTKDPAELDEFEQLVRAYKEALRG